MSVWMGVWVCLYVLERKCDECVDECVSVCLCLPVRVCAGVRKLVYEVLILNQFP